MKQHNSFNIDNKSAYYYDFWRSCDTEVIMLKIQLCFTGVNYRKKYINIENIILNCNNISNGYSIDEHKKLLKLESQTFELQLLYC